jgi:tetratricopeptide (TPR) repeat protein
MEYYHEIWKLVHQTGDYDGAMERIATALAEYPDTGTLLDLRAAVYGKRGEYEKALADYAWLLDRYPQPCAGRVDAFHDRGYLYEKMGEYDKAIADFTECIPMGPEGYGTYWTDRGIAYFKKGDLDAALADLTTSIETWNDPRCTGWALLHRGIVWRTKGDLKKALADFRKAAARDPCYAADPLYQAGYIWFLRGNPEKAIGYFSRAIGKQGDVADYWLARGVCYWNLCVKNKTNYWGEEGETMNLAADDFSKAIEYDPGMADAWCNRGTVRCAKAQESHNLIKAILTQKAAGDVERAALLARLERLGGHDYVPQTDALLRGLRAGRDEADVLMGKSFGLFAEYDAREAVEDLTRAVELDPGSAEAYYQRGLAFTLLGKRDLALGDYEKALALNPAHPKAAAKRDALLESRE